MKRKRGRPKGSTKKPSAEEELAEKLVCPSEDSLLALADGSGLAPGSLECAKCCRKFSNARQLRKHVCIIVLNLGEDDAEAGTCRAGAARRAPRGEPAMCTGARLTGKQHCLDRSHPSGEVLRFVVIGGPCCE